MHGNLLRTQAMSTLNSAICVSSVFTLSIYHSISLLCRHCNIHRLSVKLRYTFNSNCACCVSARFWQFHFENINQAIRSLYTVYRIEFIIQLYNKTLKHTWSWNIICVVYIVWIFCIGFGVILASIKDCGAKILTSDLSFKRIR